MTLPRLNRRIAVVINRYRTRHLPMLRIHTLRYATNVAGRRITVQAGIWNGNYHGSNLHLNVTPAGGDPIHITGPSKNFINPVLLTEGYQEIDLTYSASGDLTVVPGEYAFSVLYTMIDP